MSSSGDVAAQVSQACDKASQCRNALAVAQDLAEDAQAILAAALEGSGEPDADGAVANFGEVVTGVVDLWGILGSGMNHAQAVLDVLTGGSPPPPRPVAPQAAQPTQQAKPDEPPAIPPERIEHLRRELPPPVVPNSGQKTHGRWTTPDGEVRPLVSGYGELLEECEKAFPDLGLRRGLPNIAAHVETKLAAYMRNHNIPTATLIINNWPCEDGPLTCEQVVPALLPEGHTLTVYGPNGFSRTYRGGATPPWRKR